MQDISKNEVSCIFLFKFSYKHRELELFIIFADI